MFVFLIFGLMSVVSAEICDNICICRPHSDEVDTFGDVIDCSYRISDLNHNYTLPKTAFSLILTSNNLTSIKQSRLLNSKTLIQLYLNKNRLKEITSNDIQLPELRYLDLSNNLLEAIHQDVFDKLRKLEYLNLANNNLVTFARLTFHHLSALNEIILDNNNLGDSLKENDLFNRNGYGLTHKIKSISISGINLNHVSDNFFIEAYDLKKLVISNNNLIDVFEFPFTLEHLDLSDNPIKQIASEDFSNLPALKQLRLNNLLIHQIDDYVFEPLHGLVKLQLERNRNLTEFSSLAFGREVLDDPDDFTLEELSLRGSRLTSLDKVLIEPFGQLVKLDLQGNPWRCDCNLLWLKELQIQPDDYFHLRCSTPAPLYNSKVFELPSKYFTCQSNKHATGATIAVISLCTLMAIIAVWMFIILPRYQTRCNFISEMYAPSTAYSMLPVSQIPRTDRA